MYFHLKNDLFFLISRIRAEKNTPCFAKIGENMDVRFGWEWEWGVGWDWGWVGGDMDIVVLGYSSYAWSVAGTGVCVHSKTRSPPQ